ncbi:hypothetical protein EVAR_24181_1 [Eumeta japonica]|uniref:Uncharacterized protein n=1 Tax=Eumeta variegata TaxID=151549 RepID=A0A4C1W3T6_EUMVA|nr:hypothetical protein EVAR_24181_1 [Eumeta japonica]
MDRPTKRALHKSHPYCEPLRSSIDHHIPLRQLLEHNDLTVVTRSSNRSSRRCVDGDTCKSVKSFVRAAQESGPIRVRYRRRATPAESGPPTDILRSRNVIKPR